MSITYNYAHVILSRRLRVPKVKLFQECRKHEKKLSVNSRASKVNFKKFQGTLITCWVVTDSNQVPRVGEAWPLPAITTVYLLFVFLQFSYTNKQKFYKIAEIGSRF